MAASATGQCDDRAPEHVVTLWTTSVLDGYANPIPEGSGPCADGNRDGDPLTWAGGCARAVTCVENTDVQVLFDLPTLSGRAP